MILKIWLTSFVIFALSLILAKISQGEKIFLTLLGLTFTIFLFVSAGCAIAGIWL